jgi:hypothetical protein
MTMVLYYTDSGNLRWHNFVTILLRLLGFSTFGLLGRCQEYGNKVLESPVVHVIL